MGCDFKNSKYSLVYVLSEFRNDAFWFNQIIEMLDRLNMRVMVIVLASEYPIFYQTHIAKLNCVDLVFLDLRNRRSRASLAVSVFRILREGIPHTVHAHGYLASIITIPIAKFLRINNRIITRHHGLLHRIEHNAKAMLADRLVGKLASRIIVHSKFLECELTERERWPYEKVVHIPLGISVEDFLEVSDARINNLRAEIGIPKSKTIVGLNARPVSYKGITYFIESARHLAKKDSSLHFLLINMQDSELKRNLCNLVAGYPITFIETVSDLPAFYKLIQVFCHVPTSREAEPAGFVYLEAIAAGVPSVFTISGLLPEIDLHDMPISIIDYRSSEQLSQAILVRLKENWVLQDSERRVRLTNFTLLKFLEAHKILYSNL